MSDGLLFFLGLVFFFILWLVSGGPSRPISFSGPFITPITNEHETQTGYGGQLDGTISAAGLTIGTNAESGANGIDNTIIKNTSPFAGEVMLTHFVDGLGQVDPRLEYLGLSVAYDAPSSINISGWRVISTVSGNSAVIPDGVPMLTLGTVTLQPIVLLPGNTATITTGPSPVNVSFEQNKCSNYLASPDDYMHCFLAQSASPDFLSGIWRIYLNRGARLWRDTGETIELVDANGKVVDSFSY